MLQVAKSKDNAAGQQISAKVFLAITYSKIWYFFDDQFQQKYLQNFDETCESVEKIFLFVKKYNFSC